MLKTFFRRWWITNRLYHFLRKRAVVAWIKQSDFINDLIGESPSYLMKWPYSLLFNAKESKDSTDISIELQNLILECVDKQVEWIGYENDKGTPWLRLSSRGKEIYSVSYLIFGHDYARKIWTGVIVAMVAWFITSQLKTSNQYSGNDDYKIRHRYHRQ